MRKGYQRSCLDIGLSCKNIPKRFKILHHVFASIAMITSRVRDWRIEVRYYKLFQIEAW